MTGEKTMTSADPSTYLTQSFLVRKSELQLPTSLPVMLGLAMFGHAFWNGSSVLVSHLALNLPPLLGLILDLTWDCHTHHTLMDGWKVHHIGGDGRRGSPLNRFLNP